MDSPNALPGTLGDFTYYEYIEFMKPLRTAAVSISDRGWRKRGGLVLAGLNNIGWKGSNGKKQIYQLAAKVTKVCLFLGPEFTSCIRQLLSVRMLPHFINRNISTIVYVYLWHTKDLEQSMWKDTQAEIKRI